MLIVTPEAIEEELFRTNFVLQPTTQDLVKSSGGKQLTKDQLQELDTPAVTLGQPEWWNLARLVREKGDILPAELALQMRTAEFFLVRCACSFQPSKSSEIEWARLITTLQAQHGEIPPTAFDIYPKDIYRQLETDVKINIAPSLKFSEIELKPGEILATIHFTKLEPIIVGVGVQESNPSWDFEKYAKQGVRGAKFIYMIVKRPISTPSIQIHLDVIAKVKTRHGILPAKIEGLGNNLIQTICT